MPETILRVGIASFAHGHAYSYASALQTLPEAQFVGVWDADSQRGQAAAQRYNVNHYVNYTDLLQMCDAVIIAAENANHHPLVLEAAKAKVHVLCEKPLATNPGDALEMVQACADAGVSLGTAFPVRYSPAIRRLRAAIQSGAFGETLMIRSTNRGTYPGSWFSEAALSGGGALMDHIVHVADLLRWIWGSEFQSVYAEAATRHHDISVDDCGMLLITLKNGTVVSLDPSWSRPAKSFPTWGDVTFDITGTNGMASVDVFAQNVELFNDQQVRARLVPWGDDFDKLMIQDWLQAILAGKPAPITGEDGLRTVELVTAAYQSANTHSVVQLAQAAI